MGGNVAEWTTEICDDAGIMGDTPTWRGGIYTDVTQPPAWRYNNNICAAFEYVGFRVALYIQV